MASVIPYAYSESDFILQVTSTWQDSKECMLSKFDKFVLERWHKAMESGYFRYDLEGLKFRQLPGKIGYLLQLNYKRASLRRKPQFISSMNMPFEPAGFSFTKVPEREIICKLMPQTAAWDSVGWSEENVDGVCNSANMNTTAQVPIVSNNNTTSCNGKLEEQVEHCNSGLTALSRHVIIINESPFHEGHVLIVPDIDQGLNQRLTHRSILLSVEVLLLSTHPGFRIAYNSLCAYASVNHLHLHGWYVEQSFYIERADVKPLCPGVWETVDLASKALVFQLAGISVPKLAWKVFQVVDYMQRNEIAHNLFMIRGPVCDQAENQAVADKTLRIYLWPRKKVTGKKNELAVKFYPAVAELSGDVMVYQEEAFETLTADEIDAELADSIPEEYESVCDFVKSIFTI